MENFGFNQGSIARRLLLQMVVISLLATAIIGALQIHFRYREKFRSIDDGLLRIEVSHRKNLSEQLVHFDEELLSAELQSIMTAPEIQFVEVRNAIGQRVALGTPGTGDHIERQFHLRLSDQGVLTELGSLTMHADLKPIRRELWAEATAIFLWAASQIFVFAFLLFFLFQFTIARHLRDLSRQALALDLEGPDAPFHLHRPSQKGKSADELEYLTASLNGLYAYLRTTIDNLRHTNDRLYHEIGERKIAEEALRRANLVVENSPVIVFRWQAAEGWPVDMVSRNISQFGYTQEELLSGDVPFTAIVHPEDLQRVSREVQEYSANGTDRFQQEYRMRTKEGDVRWVDDRTVIEREDDGRITFHQGIVLDITDRKLIEQELAESHRMLRTVIENIPARVFWKDSNSRYLGCNLLFAQDAGRSQPDDLVGSDDFNMPWTEQADLYRADDRAVMDCGIGKINYEESQTAADGRQVWLRTTKIPLRDSGGTIYGMLGSYEDITESKLVQESLKASLAEKESLLKEVHHRVKNNLQIISSLLNLQGRNAKSPEIIEFLRDTQNRVRSMALLHETLYRSGDFAKISFPQYVKGICAHLARSYAGDAQGIRLRQDIADVTLDMDHAIPAGLIISELVANAFKHAFLSRPDGEILVSLRKADELHLVLRVSDNGVGFPTAARSSSPETLGLTLVQNLSRQLDGQLSIACEQGSIFEIVFPAQAG